MNYKYGIGEYEIGKTEISEDYLNKITKEIIDVLKKEKQTYAVNKFVLQNAINELDEFIID